MTARASFKQADAARLLRAARHALDMTQHELAAALRMGKWGFQTVSVWERDGSTVPGPVQVAVMAMLSNKGS